MRNSLPNQHLKWPLTCTQNDKGWNGHDSHILIQNKSLREAIYLTMGSILCSEYLDTWQKKSLIPYKFRSINLLQFASNSSVSLICYFLFFLVLDWDCHIYIITEWLNKCILSIIFLTDDGMKSTFCGLIYLL